MSTGRMASSAVRAPARSTQRSRRWAGRPWWNPRHDLTLKVSYRGGSECYIQVEARGETNLYHGGTAIYDLLRDVWQWDSKP